MSEPAPLPKRPHALYRMYDATRSLLYVGISVHLPTRLTEHRDDKPWWSDVATIDVAHFPDRAAAESAERDAIQAEAPKFNVLHVVREKVSGRGSRRTTPPRTTQIDDDAWELFGAVTDERGLTRAGVMRDLVLWFIRWPGAKMPPRPPAK